MTNRRGKGESNDRFPLLGLQNHCWWWLQPWNQETIANLGRKAMTNLDSVLKSRHITLLTKVRVVKAMVFPVVTHSCESWTRKKAESQRITAFKLWCWRRLLKVPWTRRGSNQSILREIHPEYSLEGLMLKLQYFGCLMRTDSLEKYLMLGKIRGRRRRGCWRMRWLDGITDAMNWCWANSRRWWGTGKPSVLLSMGSQRVRHDWLSGKSRASRTRPHSSPPPAIRSVTALLQLAPRANLGVGHPAPSCPEEARGQPAAWFG